jgi:hypothetical protein
MDANRRGLKGQRDMNSRLHDKDCQAWEFANI